VRRIIAALLLGIVLAASPLSAHPIHTTMTQVTVSRVARGYEVELRVRAFVDDFSAAVATAGGRVPPKDSSFAVRDAAAYLNQTVRLYEGRSPVKLEWCGMRREKDVVWLCLKTASPISNRQLALSQRMHMTLYDDQVNVVKVNDGGRNRSLLFVGRDGVKHLR
jgi:hypothetical protein